MGCMPGMLLGALLSSAPGSVYECLLGKTMTSGSRSFLSEGGNGGEELKQLEYPAISVFVQQKISLMLTREPVGVLSEKICSLQA